MRLRKGARFSAKVEEGWTITGATIEHSDAHGVVFLDSSSGNLIFVPWSSVLYLSFPPAAWVAEEGEGS